MRKCRPGVFRKQGPEQVGSRRNQMNVARLWMKDDPVIRVVEVGPDEAVGGLPMCFVAQNPPHEDMLADAGQLAVV